MSTPHHPGHIVYVDENAHTQTQRDVSTVPEALRFGTTTDGRLVPVVKVIAHTVGDQRTIREYGPQGELLRSTVQTR